MKLLLYAIASFGSFIAAMVCFWQGTEKSTLEAIFWAIFMFNFDWLYQNEERKLAKESCKSNANAKMPK